MPNAMTIATLCSSPPDNVFTSWSMMFSKLIGFNTSVWNCGCMNACLMRFSSNIRTDPGNFGEIVCGFNETANCCFDSSSSGDSTPASMRTNVVFPVPFSPSMTMISESVKLPASTVSLNPPSVFVIAGYSYCAFFSMIISSAVSTILKESVSSRKRRFSVGM
ncbi:hypothetical protein EV121DRAFT_204895 [Schizophyllum commune]